MMYTAHRMSEDGNCVAVERISDKTHDLFLASAPTMLLLAALWPAPLPPQTMGHSHSTLLDYMLVVMVPKKSKRAYLFINCHYIIA